jgi:hypothetical protein
MVWKAGNSVPLRVICVSKQILGEMADTVLFQDTRTPIFEVINN